MLKERWHEALPTLPDRAIAITLTGHGAGVKKAAREMHSFPSSERS